MLSILIGVNVGKITFCGGNDITELELAFFILWLLLIIIVIIIIEPNIPSTLFLSFLL